MIIGVSCLKGGPGKSTIACNLAVCLAVQGYNVALIDADESNKSASWFVRNRMKNSPELPQIALYEANENSFCNILDEANKIYDAVVIDGCPSVLGIALYIMMFSDYMIMPIVPGGFDMQVMQKNVSEFKKVMARAQKQNSFGGCFVVNRDEINPNARLIKELREVVESANLFPILSRTIFKRNIYSEVLTEGLGVIETNNKQAQSEIKKVYNAIMQQIPGNVRLFEDELEYEDVEPAQ